MDGTRSRSNKTRACVERLWRCIQYMAWQRIHHSRACIDTTALPRLNARSYPRLWYLLHDPVSVYVKSHRPASISTHPNKPFYTTPYSPPFLAKYKQKKSTLPFAPPHRIAHPRLAVEPRSTLYTLDPCGARARSAAQRRSGTSRYSSERGKVSPERVT